MVILAGGLIFLTAGMVCFLLGVRSLIPAFTPSNWDTVDGRIVSVEINRTNKGARRASEGTVRTEASYHYEYGGKSYEGTGIHPAYMGGNNFEEQHALVKRLDKAMNENRDVRVRVLRDDPAQAYLSIELSPKNLLLPLFSLPFILGGAVLTCVAIRMRRSRRTADFLERNVRTDHV